jgi:hypothetical protein
MGGFMWTDAQNLKPVFNEEIRMAMTGNKYSRPNPFVEGRGMQQAQAQTQAAQPLARPAKVSSDIPLPDGNVERKRIPIWTHLIEYFPDAFLAVVDVSVKGNDQHNPGEPLHWAREKSTDQMNTAMRHMWDHGRGQVLDTDGAYHLAKAIWRLSAELQMTIERVAGEPGVNSDPGDWYTDRGTEPF